MPAALPGATHAENIANPSAGRPVLFDLMHGPKGSMLDRDQANRASTGGLSTGIGFGPQVIFPPTAPASIVAAGFQDNYTPGLTKPDGTTIANSTLMHIGGGRSIVTAGMPVPGVAGTQPFTAGFGIGAAGNGGSRDAGAGPAFTGFPIKTVTAAAGVAVGAAVETGFANRSFRALVTGESTFGSSTTASPAIA